MPQKTNTHTHTHTRTLTRVGKRSQIAIIMMIIVVAAAGAAAAAATGNCCRQRHELRHASINSRSSRSTRLPAPGRMLKNTQHVQIEVEMQRKSVSKKLASPYEILFAKQIKQMRFVPELISLANRQWPLLQIYLCIACTSNTNARAVSFC